MAEQQTIKYAPQWKNMTVNNVTFQTTNVVGNFNYPPNVPAYKPIMKFLLNCLLNKAFTNCPSMVYQNFLREFWSTAIGYDPFPSTDEPKKRPFREFLIKFSVLGKNYSSTEQVNSIQQLLAYCLITGTEVDIREIIYSDLVTKLVNKSKDPSKVTDIELTTHMIAVNNKKDSVSLLLLAAKPKKGKSQTMTPTLPKSQGLEVLGALSNKSKRPKFKKPPTETKVTPPNPTEGSEQSHSVSSGTVPDP
ncbi:hypothetical protein Tco_1215480 [Tanacetum coccineum]